MKTAPRSLLQAVQSLLLGLVLGVFALEAIGALLAGWNLWVHRAGVDASPKDAVFASASIAALAVAPVLGILAFTLERAFSGYLLVANGLAISAVVVRMVLVTLPSMFDLMPWTAQILNGKRIDLIVGIGAASVWMVIVYLNRRSLK